MPAQSPWLLQRPTTSHYGPQAERCPAVRPTDWRESRPGRLATALPLSPGEGVASDGKGGQVFPENPGEQIDRPAGQGVAPEGWRGH